MYCKNCGKENAPGAAFCLYCGSALSEAVEKKVSNGPTSVLKPKKRNIAALALGALSIVLAIALVLSLTGVLSTGGAASASKSFGTPEDAIKYFVDRLKAGDYDGCLSACAVDEMAQGFDYKAFSERMNALVPLTLSYLPSEYKQYIEYNKCKFEQQIIGQMTYFSASFSISDEYAGIIDGQTLPLKEEEMPNIIIEQLDPSNINGLELIDIGKARRHDDERNREMQKKQAGIYGADDIQFRIVLYRYDGHYCVGGFTVIEYGGRWMIQYMSDPLAGISSFGIPIPVSGRQAYEDMLE